MNVESTVASIRPFVSKILATQLNKEIPENCPLSWANCCLFEFWLTQKSDFQAANITVLILGLQVRWQVSVIDKKRKEKYNYVRIEINIKGRTKSTSTFCGLGHVRIHSLWFKSKNITTMWFVKTCRCTPFRLC